MIRLGLIVFIPVLIIGCAMTSSVLDLKGASITDVIKQANSVEELTELVLNASFADTSVTYSQNNITINTSSISGAGIAELVLVYKDYCSKNSGIWNGDSDNRSFTCTTDIITLFSVATDKQLLKMVINTEGENRRAGYTSPVIFDIIVMAEAGDPQAQLAVGVSYAKNLNYEEAIKWFIKAAEQGIAEAQYNLGIMYTNGRGVQQDYNKAFEWYTKASYQGFADAQYNLGVMFLDGQGMRQDHNKAIELFAKAANQGNSRAQYNLGVMYFNGYGVRQDYYKAIEWHAKAAYQQNRVAQSALGAMYLNGHGVKQDIIQGCAWVILSKETQYRQYCDYHFVNDRSLNRQVNYVILELLKRLRPSSE